MAKDFKGKDDAELFKKITNNEYMSAAVVECYETLRDLLISLLDDEGEKKIITLICGKVETSIEQRRFLSEFRTSGLPLLSDKLENFLKNLLTEEEDTEIYNSQIINVLQDIMEIITHDVMINGSDILERAHPHNLGNHNEKKEHKFVKINIHLTQSRIWKDKVRRLQLLLTEKESAINVPTNIEARRRITFFTNSLFMNMPKAPKVRDMLSFSVLTPYYKEDVLYAEEELNKENESYILLCMTS